MRQIECILEKKHGEMEVLQEKVDKIDEHFDKSIQEQVLKLSEVVIGKTVKAVVSEFEKKQGDFEKVNNSKLNSLHDTIQQLSSLVQTLLTPSTSTSQNYEVPSRHQPHRVHQQQAPRGPPWSSAKK